MVPVLGKPEPTYSSLVLIDESPAASPSRGSASGDAPRASLVLDAGGEDESSTGKYHVVWETRLAKTSSPLMGGGGVVGSLSCIVATADSSSSVAEARPLSAPVIDIFICARRFA